MSKVKNQQEFREYLINNGVGQNDRVSDSVTSYMSYIKHVAKHTQMDVTPESLKNQDDIKLFVDELYLSGKVSKKTIDNYISAMKQYVSMVSV